MSDKFVDRRWHSRFRLSLPIKLRRENGGEWITGQTVDLSDGGALLSMPSHLVPPVGSRVSVELEVPESQTAAGQAVQVNSQAKVVRHQPGQVGELGVAIQFMAPLDLGLVDE